MILSDWSLLSRVINITEQILPTNGLCIVKSNLSKEEKVSQKRGYLWLALWTMPAWVLSAQQLVRHLPRQHDGLWIDVDMSMLTFAS